MKSFLKRIESGELMISDGGMGTQLAERGVDITGCVEKVNLTDRTILEDIAKLYLDAGAEIIQTNTFGASPLKLAMHGMTDEAEKIVSEAVAAVKAAVGERAYVSGSIGPSGRLLKPYGDCDLGDMSISFELQARALIDNGVDLICVETMTDLNEARIAIEAVRKVSAAIPIMATMTFDSTPKGFITVMGVDVDKAIDGLTDAGANIIGSNCGNGIENMIKIAREFKGKTQTPIIIQSNAGLPEIKKGELSYPESPEFMADKAVDLKKLGVSVIGGCCGTSPDHIRAIKNRIKA